MRAKYNTNASSIGDKIRAAVGSTIFNWLLGVQLSAEQAATRAEEQASLNAKLISSWQACKAVDECVCGHTPCLLTKFKFHCPHCNELKSRTTCKKSKCLELGMVNNT